MFAFLAVAHQASAVIQMSFYPPVVPETQTDPVRFEALVQGGVPPVLFNYDGVDRPMYDDGTHGDRVAGDGLWTILFTPEEILSKNTGDQVFRPFIGTCRASKTGTFDVFAEVWTSEIGLRTVRPIDATGQETDYVVNYTATRNEIQGLDAQKWAKRFYATHGDKYDFLNFVLIYDLIRQPSHTRVKQPVQGIDASVFDNSASYGSSGRLLGFTTFPMPTFFDGAGQRTIHEMGHQWMNFLTGTPFGSGIPHWPKGDIAINVMGVAMPNGAFGRYNFTFTPNGSGGYVVGPGKEEDGSTFNSMELYLMGLVPPAEVGTFFVLKDQTRDLTVGQTLQPSDITLVTVNDVIAARGPRVPSSADAPKTFRCATIILSEQLLDAPAMSFYDYFARRFEARHRVTFNVGRGTGTTKPWFLATGGRSTISANVADTPAPIIRLANISTRLRVGAGDEALIGGFIVTGTQSKRVIVRALGPSLPFADRLENPTLELRDASGTLLDSNDDWVDSPNKQSIIDSGVPPPDSRESAIIRTLPANNAGYTAIVRGLNDATGIGLVEAYDLNRTADSKLANISTRGRVSTGDNVLIAGTIVLGDTTQTVMVRAIGPSLTIPGKLENPTLELRDGNGALLETNDNWVESANKQAIVESTIAPTNDLESAMVRTLTPANYTAIVRGVNDTTGIGLVEVYALQ